MLLGTAFLDALVAAMAGEIDGATTAHVVLVYEPFVPSPDIDPSSLLTSSGGVMGADFKLVTTGYVVSSPEGVPGVAVNEPSGGLKFQVTSPPPPDMFAYGVLIYDTATPTVAIWSGIFVEPVEILSVLQVIQINAVLGFLPAPMLDIYAGVM